MLTEFNAHRNAMTDTDININQKVTTLCFSHAGPKAWNKLPTELQNITDHRAFRHKLKTFLFERAFTT